MNGFAAESAPDIIPSDSGSVRTTSVTRSTMYLFVNGWFPSWLTGERPTSDRYTYVDWVEYDSR